MNLKPRILLIFGLLVTGATVDAQGPPVNSPDYHAIHNAQSPYYQGPRPAQQPAPDRPTGYWQKTWGAIAPSPVGGVLGTAVGASSKKEAERLALEDCKAERGEGMQGQPCVPQSVRSHGSRRQVLQLLQQCHD